MAGRLALVIGSECQALGRLGFTGQRAADLHDALVRSEAWRPVADTGPVLDPDVSGLKGAITGAFATADAARATLLIAFVGHGVTAGAEDLYLLARDSPAVPDSDSGFHLVQGIRERLSRHQSIDGLVILIDACEAGEGLRGAARRWDVLSGGGRMELLVASTDGSAYNGCFTSTLVRAFAAGVPRAGESLRCADVQPALNACPLAELPVLPDKKVYRSYLDVPQSALACASGRSSARTGPYCLSVTNPLVPDHPEQEVPASEGLDTLSTGNVEPLDLTVEELGDAAAADPEVEPVSYSGTDFDAEGLVRRLRRGDIVVPTFGHGDDSLEVAGFQRGFVWRRPQMDRFIESLLLGFPIPGIMLVQQSDKRYLVLDGQQRLTTLDAMPLSYAAGLLKT